jgi:hypothetical protein
MNSTAFSNLKQRSAVADLSAAEPTTPGEANILIVPETGPDAGDRSGTEQSIPRIIATPNGGERAAAQLITPQGAADPRTPSFDLAKLRLSQNFADGLGVKKALLTVPVRKPDRQSFIRVNPDEAHRLEVAMLELKRSRDLLGGSGDRFQTARRG